MARSVGLDHTAYFVSIGQVGSRPDPAREPLWAQRERVRERTKTALTAATASAKPFASGSCTLARWDLTRRAIGPGWHEGGVARVLRANKLRLRGPGES
jgi:hypothetical protein